MHRSLLSGILLVNIRCSNRTRHLLRALGKTRERTNEENIQRHTSRLGFHRLWKRNTSFLRTEIIESIPFSLRVVYTVSVWQRVKMRLAKVTGGVSSATEKSALRLSHIYGTRNPRDASTIEQIVLTTLSPAPRILTGRSNNGTEARSEHSRQ